VTAACLPRGKKENKKQTGSHRRRGVSLSGKSKLRKLMRSGKRGKVRPQILPKKKEREPGCFEGKEPKKGKARPTNHQWEEKGKETANKPTPV